MGMKASLKRLVKTTLSGLLYYCGALHLLKRVVLRDRAFVLMYHRVLTPRQMSSSMSHSGIIVEDAVFERQMRFLSRTFNVMRPEDFTRLLAAGEPLPAGSCLVTFDDGWEDNYTNALPVLERLNMPALIFLTEGFIGTREMFWQERMTACLAAICRERTPAGLEMLKRCGLEAGAGREEIRGFVASLKRLPPAQIERALEEAAGCLRSRPETPHEAFMDWEQVRRMAGRGLSFGSHGVTHRILTSIDRREADAEIGGSRRALAGRLGRAPESFSYPNGNYDGEIAAMVKRHGYGAAFTTRPGFVARGDDPFAIKRINVHNDGTSTIPLFFCKILGIF